MPHRSFRPLALLVLGALPLAAQQPRALPAPNATLEEPFSQVAGVRELANGRVVVADGRDKILAMVDFRSQAITKIGREGSGPGEFGMPARVFLAPGDTTFLFDPLNTRYLVIGPDAKPATTFMIETAAPAAGPGGMRVGGFTMARTTDARGRLYAESPPISIGADGRPQTADSVVITRYDRATKKLDSLAWIRLPKNNAQVSGSQGQMQIRIGGSNPLQARDEWTVFPDGRVAIVRASDYHVDWVLPNGQRRATPALPFTPIRVTEADKKEEEEIRNRARANQMMMSVENGPNGVRRSVSMGPGANAPPLPPLTDWPDVKPPFRPGMQSVWALPNGQLWVRRTEPAGAKGTLYDVIDAQGKVTHQVRVAQGLNVVGFGAASVYTTKADEDDLLYLQRHPLP